MASTNPSASRKTSTLPAFRTLIIKCYHAASGTEGKEHKRHKTEHKRHRNLCFLCPFCASCVPFPFSCESRDYSELIPQGELHFARRCRLLKLSESQRRRQRKARVREIHRVECIERLRAEPDRLTLLAKFECLLQRQIRIEEGRETHGSARAAVSGKFVRK